MFRSVLYFALALLFVSKSACGGWFDFGSDDDDEPSTNPSVLRVGVSPRYPPVIHEVGGELSGIEIAFAKGLAQSMQRELKLVEVDWDNLVDALEEGRCDIVMSGMAFTKARSIRVDFAQPYVTVGQMPLVMRANANAFSNLPSIVNTTDSIGVVRQSSGDFLVQEKFPRASRKAYASTEAAVKGLISGEVQIVIVDSPTAWWLASKHEFDGVMPIRVRFSTEYLAWAVRKGDDSMLAAANGYLESIAQSGDLDRLVERWLPFVRLQMPVVEPR